MDFKTLSVHVLSKKLRSLSQIKGNKKELDITGNNMKNHLTSSKRKKRARNLTKKIFLQRNCLFYLLILYK